MHQRSSLSILLISLLTTPTLANAQSGGDEPMLDEVIVTATKRAQSTQDIPMSVEAVSGERISQTGLRDLSDLSSTIPSFIVTESAGDRNITMRGMGSPSGQRGIEQAVAMYLDGQYLPRSKQYYSVFLDVERVEILRGPQAVLFGVNATAGAVNVISASNRPGDDFEGSLSAGAELENGGTAAKLVLGGGLGETLGVRFVAKYEDLDGFANTSSGPGGAEENEAARLSLIWQPSDSFSLTAKASYFDNLFEGQLSEQISPEGITPFPATPSNSYEHDTPSLDLTGELNGPGFKMDGTNFVISADWEVGEHTLTAIIADSEFEHVLGNDFDSGAFVAPEVHAMSADSFGSEDFEQQTAELRLVSPGGNTFDYMAGVYYQQSDMKDRSTSLATFLEQAGLFDAFGPLFGLDKGPGGPWDIPFGFAEVQQDQELWSAYASLTFNVSDNVSITAGGRYTDESKTVERTRSCGVASDGLDTVQDTAGTGACAAYDAFLDALSLAGVFYSTAANTVGTRQDIDDSYFLPEVSIMWDINDSHSLFGRVAQSAKSGGMSSSFGAIPGRLTFEPEEVTAFEIGTKSAFASGRGEFNLTLFNNEYEDLQVTSITLGGALVDNAGKATIRGAEADGRFLATEWLTLGASVAFLDAEYDEFTNAQCAAGPSETVPNGDGSCDATGLAPPMAADFSYNVYADMVFPISGSLDLLAGASASGSTDYITEGTFSETMRQDDWTMVNAYVGIAGNNGRWSVDLIGRNLSDEVLGGPGIDLGGAFFTNAAIGTRTHKTLMLRGQFNF